MRQHSTRSACTLALALALVLTSVSATAFATASPPNPPPLETRQHVIDLAAAHVGDHYALASNAVGWDIDGDGIPEFDCSGYAAFCWEIGRYYDPAAYRLTTREFYRNRSGPGAVVCFDIAGTRTDAYSQCVQGDALVYRSGNSGHIVIYRYRNPDGSIQTYEARGSAYGVGSWTRTYADLKKQGFKAIRRRNLAD